MTASSAVRSVLGLALIAGGGGLFYLALETQAQRASEAAIAARPALPPPAPSAPAASAEAPIASASSAPAGSTEPATGDAGGGDAGEGDGGDAGRDAGDAGGDGGRADASDADGSATSGEPDTFRFGAGGIVLPRDELARLVAFGKQLSRGDKGKLVIEGYGDEAGVDEKTITLGRRRATVVRQLFSDVGVELDRVSIAMPDASADPRLAGTTRVRSLPPAEGKQP